MLAIDAHKRSTRNKNKLPILTYYWNLFWMLAAIRKATKECVFQTEYKVASISGSYLPVSKRDIVIAHLKAHLYESGYILQKGLWADSFGISWGEPKNN